LQRAVLGKKKELILEQGREGTLVLATKRNTHFARNRRRTCFSKGEGAQLFYNNRNTCFRKERKSQDFRQEKESAREREHRLRSESALFFMKAGKKGHYFCKEGRGIIFSESNRMCACYGNEEKAHLFQQESKCAVAQVESPWRV
jgi:hypothetical protein